jgi:flagellar hook assembly protein FlgD
VKNTKSFKYEILNRWGEVVFEGNASIQPINYYINSTFVLWDGYTTNSIKVNEGTYFYHIIAESINDSKKEFNGFLEVVK